MPSGLLGLICAIAALVANPVLSFTTKWLQWIAVRILRMGPVPKHIAIIMDGNRRFAVKQGLPKYAGHPEGYVSLLRVLQWCIDFGVEVVTVYGWSIENFNRSKEEVDIIMQLATQKLKQMLDSPLQAKARQLGASISFCGNLELLPTELQRLIHESENKFPSHKLKLNICFSYTARHELIHAAQANIALVKDGSLKASDISEETIAEHLLVKSPPDLTIRTSGEMRMSDFLLWQATEHTYWYVTPTLWPEFAFWDMIKAILRFQLSWHEIQRRKTASANRIAQLRKLKTCNIQNNIKHSFTI